MTGAAEVDRLVEEATGRRVSGVERRPGGDIGEAWRVDTDDGPLFVKTHRHPPPTLFPVEAAGLRWLGEADALPVPAVVAVTPDLLAMEWVEPGARTTVGAEELGRGLAALHRAGARAFGGPDERQPVGHIGDVPVPDRQTTDRAAFLLDQRWRPLAWRALADGAVDPALEAMLDLAEPVLPERLGPEEAPARVHGDLWSGNVHWAADGRPWLVDPAAHGGFRETDLAMLALFGGLDPVVLGAYREAWPLPDGWEDRVRLHQVTPLLVHTVLFGGDYARQAVEALGSIL